MPKGIPKKGRRIGSKTKKTKRRTARSATMGGGKKKQHFTNAERLKRNKAQRIRRARMKRQGLL